MEGVRQTGRNQDRWVSIAVFAALLLLPLALVFGGVSMIVRSQTGVHARATVEDCETTHVYKSYSQRCTGTWTIDGRTTEGTVQGADPGDVGHTIDVTVREGEATSTSLVLPVLLIALGLPLLGVLLWPRIRRATR